jgi:hypothetical protein
MMISTTTSMTTSMKTSTRISTRTWSTCASATSTDRRVHPHFISEHPRAQHARSTCSGRVVVAALAASACIAHPASAQRVTALSCAVASRLQPRPGTPRAGSLVTLATPDGAVVRLAGIPVDSGASMTLRLPCRVNGGDSLALVVVATRPALYRQERLRVAPEFAAPPDSALAARLAREAALAAEVSRLSRLTPALWRAAFVAPRPSRVTSPFGGSRVFNGSVVSRHMGTDFAGAVGAPVRATNRGIVRLVDRFFLGGNVVYVDHGAGLVTAYLHLSRQLVSVGDTVARGAVIGHVGATGRVTGPHLHFITRVDSVTVDPATVLGRALVLDSAR